MEEQQILERKLKYGEDNVDKAGKLIYPIEVRNKTAYKDYLVASKEYEILKKKSPIRASNGKDISILSPKKTVNNKVKDLPKEEGRRIKDLNEDVLRLRGKTLGLYNRAFSKVIKKDATVDDVLFLRRFEIINWFSSLYSDEEVWRIVNYEWKVKAPRHLIKEMRKKYAEEVRQGQAEYLEKIDDIRLSHKRSRLDELLELYNGRKEIYTLRKGANDYRLLLQTLEQIRREVEGDRVTIDANLNIQIERSISIHQEELMRELPVKSLVVSMVAGRLGINPLQLMTKLANSYYSKYTGFGEQVIGYAGDDITFPSTLIYNMEEMKERAARKDEEFEELGKAEVVDSKIVEGAEDMRTSLLDNLRGMKKDLSVSKSNHTVESQQLIDGKLVNIETDDKAGRSKQIGRPREKGLERREE